MSALEQAAREALEAPGCERLREWAAIGPVQRAAVESFAAALDAGQAQPVARDRDADRQRFTDPAFNRWLDEGISDAGHTVWDAVGDVQAAWNGWSNREFYASPPARQPLTDEQIMDLPAGVNDGKLSFLLRFARAIERAHGIT